MAEVVRERYVERPRTDSNGYGFLLGMVLLVVVLYLLFMYGLPIIRQAATPTQIQVPDKVDVNVSTPNQGAPAPQGQ